MTVRPVPTPSAPPVAGPYSPAVRAGDWLVLAGQIGIDAATGALVAGGAEAEARQVLANIDAILGDCGASWPDVAKVGIFLTDLGNFAAVNALYESVIGGHRPARTTIVVSALPAGAQVEIECWVHQPESAVRTSEEGRRA
ncbi:MAG TPA: Rid family detoxifying hydrolase [Acidimicrobiia bacterium]|nr:Rid family detoxifying hydrolase [Acidimicrobiia bacterium]